MPGRLPVWDKTLIFIGDISGVYPGCPCILSYCRKAGVNQIVSGRVPDGSILHQIYFAIKKRWMNAYTSMDKRVWIRTRIGDYTAESNTEK